MDQRQTSVKRSTTEAKIESLAFGPYQRGLPTLSLWDRPLGGPMVPRMHEDNQAPDLVARKAEKTDYQASNISPRPCPHLTGITL